MKNDWWKPLLLWLALLAPVGLLITADQWAEMTWKEPGQLAWLLLLPPLVVLLLLALWRRERLMSLFIESRLLDDLAAGVGRRRQWVRMGLVLLALAAVILALARPRWDVEKVKSTQSNLDIIVALDVSKSMLASDLEPSRLDHAKLAAKELARQAKAERLGLLYFAGGAFVKCPLTSDMETFNSEVDHTWVQNLQFQEEGTSLANLIRTANNAFVNDPSRQKALVIFTDGEDHEGEALKAAAEAKADGMVIFTVAVGKGGGGVIGLRDCPNYRCPVVNPMGRATCDRCLTRLGTTVYLTDEDDQRVLSLVNTGLLKEIAEAAKGRFVQLDSAAPMRSLYKKWLAPLAQPDDTGAVNKEIAREQYRWPLGTAMLLLLMEMFIPGHRRRRQAIGSASGVAILAGLLWFSPGARAALPFGLDGWFGSGDPAEKEEVDPDAPHAGRHFYNRGNEFYRKAAGQYAPARDSHRRLLALWDLRLQAQLENPPAVHRLIGELQQANGTPVLDLEQAAALAKSGDELSLKQLTANCNAAIAKLRPKVAPALKDTGASYTSAREQYTQALEADDLKVQQQAFYNLGNTHYQLGQLELERKVRIRKWTESAEHLRAAVKLDPHDRDAARNFAFVLRKLREEIAKLPTLREQMEVDMVNRFKKQPDAVALRIFPPSKEALPERPYFRMLVFDGYRGGVGYASPTMKMLEDGPHNGGHESWHGNRPLPEGMRLDGAEWRFQLEPLLTKHLPLPGPFERLSLSSDKPYLYSEDTFYGRMNTMPLKMLRYTAMAPADDETIEPAKADAALSNPRPTGPVAYPWTTLEVNLSPKEKEELQLMVDGITAGRELTAEKFTEAALHFLHENHEYEMMRIRKMKDRDPVMAWLKTDQPGHCEYFAYGFQLLARKAGFPVRVVCGFAGVEFDKTEGNHVSRLSMAHAWAEIFNGSHWIRVEATPPEPDRDEGGEGEPQQPENGEPQLSNQPQNEQQNQGTPQQLSMAEAMELLEAARDQEKPLSDALERMGRQLRDMDRWTNQRLERGRKRKNW